MHAPTTRHSSPRARPHWVSAGVLLLWFGAAGAGRVVPIEDWTSDAVGRTGIPSGWTGESFGRRADYDFVIEEHAGKRLLHLKSRTEHSTIVKDIRGRVNLTETPILEWTWRVTVLPKGGDIRRKETTDLAVHLYVVWPRVPEWIRSRIIGYVWDTNTPVGTIAKSQKTGTVTFIVLRAGSADLGKWLAERRNVAEDYQRIFGEPPEAPGASRFPSIRMTPTRRPSPSSGRLSSALREGAVQEVDEAGWTI